MKSETFNNSKSIIQGLKYIGNSLGRLSYSCEIDPETLFERLSIIADGAKWLIVIDKLANCQIVFTDELTLELVEKIFDSNNVEDVVSHYYFDDDKINDLICRCETAQQIRPYNTLFREISEAYEQKHYQLACIGLFALMDGVLADVSNMDVTNFTNRIKKIMDKASAQKKLGDLERKEVAVYLAIKRFEKSKELSMFYGGKFSEGESDRLKRDWLLHGRTHRDYEKIDFLKVMLWLDAIIFLSNKGTERGMQP